jgi:N-sulfoglucosamine sulfohydrolase
MFKKHKQYINFLSALIACMSWSIAAEPMRPNIIFFIADDVSQEDLGCYGHQVIKTPKIDALAAKGMRFDNAYLTISSCSPTRCSIITGRYPHNTGAPELHVPLPDSQIRFPELLRQAGYYTVLSGKNHMFKNQDRAFDKISRGVGPSAAEDWLKHLQNRPKDKPFFFWFASTDAHRDWAIGKEAPLYTNEQIIIPPYMVDTPTTREDLASYYHEVSRFDYYVGQIAEELEREGILNNTMIVVAADNGRPFPRAKARLYDSGIKTPWVVHYPDMITAPAVSQSFVSVMDLSATCLEIAGVEKPECIQGISFTPILKDANAATRDVVFAEQNWHVYRNHSRLVRLGDYAYIKNNYPNQPNLSHESDDHYPAGKEHWLAHAAGKTTVKQQQIFANPCPPEELYLLSKDPDQFTNLAGHPDHAKTLNLARDLLAKWTEQTGDTIPENPTPNRVDPPSIIDGKIVRGENKASAAHSHAEMPGAAKSAMDINHSGPIRLTE